MDAATRVTAERELERLGNAYAKHIDFGEYGKVVELFALDGVLDLPGNLCEGQEAIRNYMFARPAQRTSLHLLTNFLVEELDDSHAAGITYVTVFLYDRQQEQPPELLPLGNPAVAGYYQDRYVRVEGNWRFANRKLVPTFMRAGGLAEPIR